MKYLIRDSGKRKIDAVLVEHNGQTIEFRGQAGVNGGDADQELFEFLNEFFQSCSDDKLNKLFGLLKKAKRVMDPGYFEEEETKELDELRTNSGDYTYLTANLQEIIKEIYNVISPTEIAYAAEMTGRTKPPKDLMVMASMGDYPEETTITNEKYNQLVMLTLAAQLMFPIINQLLDQVKDVTGKDYQYAVAGSMIPFITKITDMNGWKVLDTYIRASCARQESRRNTMEVVSDARYVDHIVYRGLFGKLCLSFVPSRIKDKNLSKELNSLVEGEIRKEQAIKFVAFDGLKPGSEDQSIPESYRITQTVNGTDELACAEFFTFGMFDEKETPRLNNFFEYQCKALGIRDQATAEKLYDCLPSIWNFRYTNIHNHLLQLTYHEDTPYYLYPAMDYPQLKAAIVLGQVRLFEMGFEHLAVLLGSVRNPTGPVTYMTDEYKLTTKEREMLCEQCQIYVGQSTASTDNMLVVAVQKFLDELSASAWESNIEIGLLGNQKYIDGIAPGDMYEVQVVSEIKKELIDLITQNNTQPSEDQLGE